MVNRLTLIIFLAGMNFWLNAQDSTSNVQNPKVVVNQSMIERFNAVKTEGDFYSWSQLLSASESRNVREVLVTYRDCDLNKESLESINLALKEKTGSEAASQELNTGEYCDFINKVKQEISEKLSSGNPVAMK